MKRRRGFGVGQQGFHPRARGALSMESKRGNNPYAFTSPEMTSHYFVPSFSIRRHLVRSEEAYWAGAGKQIGSILGRHFEVMRPQNLAIKTIEQKALIHKIRQTGEQPHPSEMRDVVFNISDSLTRELESSPESLELGLGRLAVFGRNKNKLALTLEGWRGWRARYDEHDGLGQMTALGALLVESQVAVGNIATAFPEMNFSLSEIATSPHITIARTNDTIRDHELRKFQSRIDDIGLDSITVGDPVINYKLGPQMDSQSLFVRHSWVSLANTA